MPLKIRRACIDDAPALSRICLLTADSGGTAEHLHEFPELPGLVWAVPYVTLPTTWGFVLEEDDGKVVGYIVGSLDTATYENFARKNLWPVLAKRYPLEGMSLPADQAYARLLQDFRQLPQTTLDFAPAHLHIDILVSHQGRGWGRRLIEHAARHLQQEGIEGVWLIMNPRNIAAGSFYRKLGFESIMGSPTNHLGLRFGTMAC
ncbi:N-acetyltransferase domain-containing protein [Mycena indigotica]|uniref:N-acetyltransferase domain-containing protein n=1 Tax=Mycena indigotica TaxID=2126181 RepID=A0A8H6SWJ0_9AGAR|nr:N-acetyltransferase domain-containing protein [Mycena indigotica]KAF7306435.1 N-acetyltransferase domain-containing protein [Mycena indigotica]